MVNSLRIFILICGLVFDIIILRLLIKKEINEKDSIIWFIFTLCVFILAAFPQILQIVAGILKIEYPPTLLFLFSILVMFYIILNNYIKQTILNERIKELAQQIALINYKLEDLKKKDHTS